LRILVTGYRGFIGSHLTRELTEHGHDVVGVDMVANPAHDLRLEGVADDVILHSDAEVVVHLAARVGRLFGEDHLTDTVVDNAGMTALVARATAAAGARLVYASTSEVYGDNDERVCHEHTGPFTLPHNIYGLSKFWGEQVAALYAPYRLTILRFSMPYGPGLPAGRGRAALINMLWQALRGEPIIVHRGAERSWCWIGDTVEAARLAIESGDGPYNVGRDDNAIPMMHVAEMACDLVGAPHGLIHVVEPPGKQTVVKRLGTDRIRALGWTPEVSLDEGMARTLEWVKTLGDDGLPRQEGM